MVEKFILRVLGVTAEWDVREDLFWHTDPLEFHIKCSDFFHWGTADCEPLTPENVESLDAACRDAFLAGDHACCYGPSLFCARIRKMRPQGAAYPKKPELWPLFDACGPERVVGLGNPKPHPTATTDADAAGQGEGNGER